MNLKYEFEQLYRIIKIHPHCEWYEDRGSFENKTMKCIEIFPAENSAGFCFENPLDAPDQDDPAKAYCFFNPTVLPIECHEEAHTTTKDVPPY